jgi:hypothetical protein
MFERQSYNEGPMFKLIGHLVVFVVGAGVGVWWGVSHPQMAQNLATMEQVKIQQAIAQGKQQALQAVQTDLTASPTGMPNPATFTAHVQKMLADAKNDINSAQTKLSGQ